MENITKAFKDMQAREKALAEIKVNGLEDFLQVAGTKFAKDFEIENIGVMTVRIDIVVPKLTIEENAQTLHEDYLEDLRIKDITAKDKEVAKQKKIVRDTATRAKAKAEQV